MSRLESSDSSQNKTVKFALYDAFTATPYAGSQAGVVSDAKDIDVAQRRRIAKEIGAPATAFVNACTEDTITVQFFSTVAELPMCGHGTICLITRLIDQGQIHCPENGARWITLDLPKGKARVKISRRADSRPEVMLNVAPASFAPAEMDLAVLATLLGVAQSDYAQDLPIEVATGDFIHLCLPMRDLAAMGKLQPDFDRLADFCRSNGIETVAAFSTEVVQMGYHIHVRDFCPAVGVAESAAAGTTNAALAAYLLRNHLVSPDAGGTIVVRAEQGLELGRPSQIKTEITIQDGAISGLQVGGVGARVFEGVLYP